MTQSHVLFHWQRSKISETRSGSRGQPVSGCASYGVRSLEGRGHQRWIEFVVSSRCHRSEFVITVFYKWASVGYCGTSNATSGCCCFISSPACDYSLHCSLHCIGIYFRLRHPESMDLHKLPTSIFNPSTHHTPFSRSRVRPIITCTQILSPVSRNCVNNLKNYTGKN